ncbi:thioredoxin family protein [Enterobacteriaceae bacterium H11S18]|uniref:thioredoxin family protein n=1 Tax=Dryocola clanedunensis TaxID=2925396 RepID=UPI0022F0A450|nr:thioredoxin family protein [Dryocola clanedunensis]MCT4706588.1 thioredoxin family protein [Dryocola clanedunensis]MCT4713400.1 thioredoxin family protein [Dryocola clanedunensis]
MFLHSWKQNLRRHGVSTLMGITLTAVSGLASAAGIMPFTQNTYDTLMSEGKPVIVDVHATWCPVCKQQGNIIEPLVKQPKYQQLTILKLDFDAQKTELRQFNVSTQSTLIAFNKGKEVNRTIGDTSPTGITALFDKVAE